MDRNGGAHHLGRGSLDTHEVSQFQIQLVAGARRIETRGGVLCATGFDTGAQSLFEVGDRFFFGLAFAVGWDVGHAGREAALIRSPASSRP